MNTLVLKKKEDVLKLKTIQEFPGPEKLKPAIIAWWLNDTIVLPSLRSVTCEGLPAHNVPGFNTLSQVQK